MEVLPAADVDDRNAYSPDVAYDWRPLKAPTVKGFALRMLVWMTRGPLWPALYKLFATRSGVFKVLARSPVQHCGNVLENNWISCEINVVKPVRACGDHSHPVSSQYNWDAGAPGDICAGEGHVPATC
jgi:hypothetical protein